MKSITVLLLLSLFVMISASCGKSDPVLHNTSTGVSLTPDNMSLSFNGVSMSSAMPQAVYSRAAGILQITSLFVGNKSVACNINNAATGIFSIKNGDATAVFSLDSSASDVFTGTTGTVSISSFNSTLVTGSFEFSATTVNNVAGEVTNGQFRIHVITQ